MAMSEEHALEMTVRQGANRRWYVVDKNQNIYGGSFNRKQNAIDYMFGQQDDEERDEEKLMTFDTDIEKVRLHMDYLHKNEQRRLGREYYVLIKSQSAELQYLRNKDKGRA